MGSISNLGVVGRRQLRNGCEPDTAAAFIVAAAVFWGQLRAGSEDQLAAVGPICSEALNLLDSYSTAAAQGAVPCISGVSHLPCGCGRALHQAGISAAVGCKHCLPWTLLTPMFSLPAGFALELPSLRAVGN